MDIVAEALEKSAKQNEKFKSINVEKLIDLEFDIGTLLATDRNDLNVKELRFVWFSLLGT